MRQGAKMPQPHGRMAAKPPSLSALAHGIRYANNLVMTRGDHHSYAAPTKAVKETDAGHTLEPMYAADELPVTVHMLAATQNERHPDMGRWAARTGIPAAPPY